MIPGDTGLSGRVQALAAGLALAAVVLFPWAVTAQTPAAQGAQGFAEPDREEVDLGWSGSADLGFTLTEGNSETTSLSAGAGLSYRLSRQRWTFDGSFVRATADGEQTANKGDAEVMYDYFPSARFFLFAKMSAGFNEPAGLDLRLAPGLGVGYQAVSTERVELAFEAGGEWTRDAFADGQVDRSARVSAAESFAWEISGTSRLEQSVTFRPALQDLGDFLLDGRVSLTAMITDALGLKVTLRDEFDSTPFVDPATGDAREENDLTFVTGLTFRF